MHAARGLQMLAEIAGPQHQDADSNAVKSRILHWSGPGSHASPPSQPSHNKHGRSSSRGSMHPSDASIGDAPSPATERYIHSSGSSAVYNNHFQRRDPKNVDSHQPDELDLPKNINGTQMYYGDSTSSDRVLRKVAAGTAGPSRSSAASASTSIHEAMARRDMQSAFNSVLDPSRDTFPFATIWSSGTAFIEEVLPFFPRPEDFDSICASFVRHFSAMCPALTIPTAIDHAKTFSRMPRKQQAQVSLPWLAVFLMICALGKNCDLESTAVGVDRKVRMLDAFLAGEASQQPSRQASRASSPAPGEGLSLDVLPPSATASRSPAMVSDLFLSAAYQSLRLCSFLSSPTLQTIHSQLLIGAYLLNTERAASFWPLLGSVARQAQSIGLHVDPYKIRRDWDPVEADTRRRLWWAVVHQDVILSSIFGRPLGITRFSCRFPGTTGDNSRGPTTYATLQCEFSQFARTYLDENQDRSWSQAKIIEFTDKVLQWYMGIPERYRPDLGRIDLLGSETEAEAIQNYHAAGVDIKTKGLMEVHQSGNLAVEVFYFILSLHRSNFFPTADSTDPTIKDKSTPLDAASSTKPNEVSLHICAQALRRITRAQTTMIDLLGRARATMFWKIAYYTYQAAIAGAYIVFVNPQSKHAESALEDLAILTDFFDRMPERWTGLKMAKHGLRVLRKLAVAARETPEAASMALRGPVQEETLLCGVGVGSGQPEAGSVEPGVSKSDSAGGGFGAGEVHTATTPSSHLFTPSNTGGGGSDAAQVTFHAQSAFLPPLFGSSFMSPSVASQGVLSSSNTPSNGSSSVANTFVNTNFGEDPALFAASSSNSALVRSLASVPLVTLFNNTYEQHKNGCGLTPKQSFCYDPFIPDPATSHSSAGLDGAHEQGRSASPSGSDRQTSSISSPGTAFSGHLYPGGEKLANGTQASVGPQTLPAQDASPTPMNQKDLANYWSEYFSLQLDWDRLTGLA